ncbi:hypothetical protein EIP86_007737 [Pleurotus ostreatoroseus]|nr:hypothetical protein EIP86_007737 [Pleurotus ostreatoroseus]
MSTQGAAGEEEKTRGEESLFDFDDVNADHADLCVMLKSAATTLPDDQLYTLLTNLLDYLQSKPPESLATIPIVRSLVQNGVADVVFDFISTETPYWKDGKSARIAELLSVAFKTVIAVLDRFFMAEGAPAAQNAPVKGNGQATNRSKNYRQTRLHFVSGE